MNRSNAFTLIEIIIVIVILGILAAFALPRYISANEAAICSEAVNALTAYRDAQARYFMDHAAYDGTTCPNLDLDITAKNFNTLTCTSATGAVALSRIGGSYVAHASQAGTPVFTCTGGGCTATLLRACFSN